jgi:hypothetical protein
MARAERGPGRLRRLHRPLNPRATRSARQLCALVGRIAVEVIAVSVFEEERVEVQEQPVGHGAVTPI